MKRKFKYLVDDQEFVAVCKKCDYATCNSEKDIFIVYKDEWEYTEKYQERISLYEKDDNEEDTFDLLLASVKNNTIDLYPTPMNGVVIMHQLPISNKSEYTVIPNNIEF